MAIKPHNVVPVLKDRTLSVGMDFDVTPNSFQGIFPNFAFEANYFEITAFCFIITNDYIAGNQVTGSLAYSTGPAAPVVITAWDLGTTLITQGTEVVFPITTPSLIPPGSVAFVPYNLNAGQTGEAIAKIIVRPLDNARQNVSKRPGAHADAAL